MKKTVETTHFLNANIDDVWGNVRTGAEWERWLPILSGSSIEGEGAGAKRVCHTHENGDLYETIIQSDDQEKVFQYRIDEQSMMPISEIVGTMKFSANEKGTQLDWNVEFEVENDEIYAQVKAGIEEIYSASSQKLAGLSS